MGKSYTKREPRTRVQHPEMHLGWPLDPLDSKDHLTSPKAHPQTMIACSSVCLLDVFVQRFGEHVPENCSVFRQSSLCASQTPNTAPSAWWPLVLRAWYAQASSSVLWRTTRRMWLRLSRWKQWRSPASPEVALLPRFPQKRLFSSCWRPWSSVGGAESGVDAGFGAAQGHWTAR